MAVDSRAASMLLSSEMLEAEEEEDSDDCQSEDEEVLNSYFESKEHRTALVSEKDVDEGDDKNASSYHKMFDIEHRDYQAQLLEFAKKMNVIICLPTGTGKTYIALKLTEHMLPDAIANNRKIMFLANNVPLVNQQARYFSENLVSHASADDDVVRAITGDLNVDIWKEDQWNEILAKYHILVMSTQILLDAVTKAYIRWDQIELLILDECHHAQGKQPMAQLMEMYGERKNAKYKRLPRVLGLTATIIKGISKEEKIAEDIEKIEKLLCCRAVTHKNYEEVLRHSTDSNMTTRFFIKNYSVDDPICGDINRFIQLLENIPKSFCNEEEVGILERVNHPNLTSEDQLFNRSKSIPQRLKSFLNDMLRTYEELGPYCAKQAAILKFAFIVEWISTLSEYEEERQNELGIIDLIRNAQTVLIMFMKKLENQMLKETRGVDSARIEAHAIKYCVSYKIKLLWEILMSKRPSETEELCGVIFCERRITAKVLRWYLEIAAREWPGELGFIKPEVMVGHSTIVQDAKESRSTIKRQIEVLRKFHAKELNILVATQVVEEGLNVPSCNLVIRFDKIQSYPSFVQSMGRARKKGATCYALIEVSTREKEQVKLGEFVSYNHSLAEALKQNAIHLDENSEVEPAELDIPIPPFRPSDDPDGPIITATEAISLVHRYCNSLSRDRIGSLTPIAWSEGSPNTIAGPKFEAYVLLPMLSPVRQVVKGQIMMDKMLAKRSAYLEACKLLYYADELTENLLPKPRSIDKYKCEFLDNLATQHAEEKKNIGANVKVGTRKRVQQYKKAVPKALVESSITPNAEIRVYRINIDLKDYTRTDESIRLYQFDKFKLSYGILTTSNLDNVGNFELLANYGSFNVSINKCSIRGKPFITLTDNEIRTLECFQEFLRYSVWKVRNPALIPDATPSMLIAPLVEISDGTKEIDWERVMLLANSPEEGNKELLKRPSDDERKSMQFTEVKYTNAVMVPWYKEDTEPELWCSLQVMNDACALSEFDEPKKFANFGEYYKQKYDVDIFHPNFPLIQCKSIANQLNFLNSKTTDGKSLRKEITRSILRIVPELTHVHALPGSLYIQGKFLPSILHRINRLLVANEMRLAVAAHFNWDVERVPERRDYEAEMEVDLPDSTEDDLDNFMDQVRLVGPKEDQEKSYFSYEGMNPLKISWEDVGKSITSKKRGGTTRDSKYYMPEAPVQKTNLPFELLDINKIEFPSFDQRTDFSVEKGPSDKTIMEALTLSNAQDCISLEKLEVMGDSVLKLIVSLHVFRNFPRWDEGKMTLLRTKLISNLHLYQLGKSHNLGEILSGSYFIPDSSWLPCGFKVPEYLEEWVMSQNIGYSVFANVPSDVMRSCTSGDEVAEVLMNLEVSNSSAIAPHTTYSHSNIGDKSVADAVEAIIGAYYVNGGVDAAFRVMEWLGLKGPLEDGSAESYSRQSTLTPSALDIPISASNPKNFIPLLERLEKTLQYKFKNPWLAVEALTHPSYINNRVTSCYERLEFVGDAILDFLVTNYIIKETKITDPGKITDLRAALVNNVTFAALAVRYGFHQFLKYDSQLLESHMTQFVQYQEDNGHTVSDPHKLFSDFDCPTVKEIEVPKVLGDIFESIAGAIFVDSGMSIDAMWKVFYRLMKNELELFSKKIPKNPLRELFENFPGKAKFRKFPSEVTANPKSKHHISPKYQMVLLKVPGYDRFIVGVGSTVKQAKQAAAKYVIRDLKSKSIIK